MDSVPAFTHVGQSRAQHVYVCGRRGHCVPYIPQGEEEARSKVKRLLAQVTFITWLTRWQDPTCLLPTHPQGFRSSFVSHSSSASSSPAGSAPPGGEEEEEEEDGGGDVGGRTGAALGPLRPVLPQLPAGRQVHQPRQPKGQDCDHHRGKRRDRKGNRPGSGPARGTRHSGLPGQSARRGGRLRHQEGEWEQRGPLHALGFGQPEIGARFCRDLLAVGASPRPPHQQRRHWDQWHQRGRLQHDFPGEPFGPLPPDPSPPGPAETLRPKPGGAGGFRRAPVREHRQRHHPQTSTNTKCIQVLRQQQIGQYSSCPRAGQQTGWHQRDLLLPPPRSREHRYLSPHLHLAEAFLLPHQVALLPRLRRRGSDVDLLCHAGRHRAV